MKDLIILDKLARKKAEPIKVPLIIAPEGHERLVFNGWI